MKKNPKPSSRPITTRSGKVLKVNRSFSERYIAMRQAKTLRKVNRLSGLPKSRFKRTIWRLHPKRLAAYWFSRDGGIMALKVTGIVILAMFVFILGVFAYFRKDLKSITDVSGSNLGGSISYYDSTGGTLLWSDYNAVKRVPVANINDISPYLRNATVAVEDKDFYKHRGFALKSIIRATLVDALHRGSTQGGSTITQQLVKLTHDFNQERSISLKIKELILAVELERTYTKDDILRSYLNAAPYGSVDYGVQTAAQDYFHTNAKDLTLAQAAFLATIPKAPAYYSEYSPYFDEKAFTSRDHYVLDQMAAQGKITKKQAIEAKKVNVLAQVQPQQTKYAGIQAPYFVLAARDELNLKHSGSAGNVGGWKVITTLDTALQAETEKAVANNIPNLNRYGGDEEAMVVEDTKTGQMRALVGGTDFNNKDHGQFNYAHQAYISPGSSFKPYDYVTLINNNTSVGAGSVLYDSQSVLPGYPCTIKGDPKKTNCLHDYDFRYPGPLTLRYALGGSRNVPAVKAMLEAESSDTSSTRSKSVNKVISTADQLMDAPNAYKCFKDGTDVNNAKSSDETQCYGASAIGDGAYLHLDQHVNGVASLARLGNAIPSTYIKSIQNTTGKTIYTFKQPKGTQIVRPDAAYIINDMASDPQASYLTNSQKWQHYKGWNTAIKTGTTNDAFDGLMMSWNTQYAVGSWVGYHTRNQSLNAAGMELITLPLTRTVMEYALDSLNTTPVNWKAPAGIQTLPAFKSLTAFGTQGPSPTTDIFPSWYKQRSASSQTVTVDRVSNKMATNCTPDSAKQTTGGNSAPNTYSIDEFYPPNQSSSPSSSTAASGSGDSDDVHKCGDSPPTISLTADSSSNGSTTVTAFVSAGTHPFNDPQYTQFPGTVTFSFGGQTVHTEGVSDPSSNVSFNFTPTASGTMTATVTDSVLYSASATADITANPGPTGFTVDKTGPLLTFKWSGGNAPFTVYRANGTPVGGTCSNNSSNNCTASGGGGSFYVQDNDANKSTPDNT